MSVVRWNPMREIDGLFGRSSDLANFPNAERTNVWQPLVDIREPPVAITLILRCLL